MSTSYAAPKSSPKAAKFMAWGAHAARKHAGQQVLESLVPSRVAVGAPADRFFRVI
jgi:hypothetical protein